MQRPDLTTLACVNADCQHYGRPGQGNLTVRKVYGQDGVRLLRCRQVFMKSSLNDAIPPCSTRK